MMIEEREHFQVLLEDIQTSVKVIAEGHGALVKNHAALLERLDRMESKFESRFDRLEVKFNGLEPRVGGLEVFASDAQQRLKRIEGHLELNGSSRSSPPRKATRTSLPKRHKKP